MKIIVLLTDGQGAYDAKMEEKKSSLSSLDSDSFFELRGYYGTKILMDDYYTFLKERKINTEGRFREDYWKNDRDRYRTTTVQNSTPMFY